MDIYIPNRLGYIADFATMCYNSSVYKKAYNIRCYWFITSLCFRIEGLYVIEKGMRFSEYIIFKVCFGGRTDWFYFTGITELIYGTAKSE